MRLSVQNLKNLKNWLIPGLCLLLVISLGFNAGQALYKRSLNGDALNALSANVDSALGDLDSAVYLDANSDWNSQSFCWSLYKSLLQARDEAAAAAQLAPLNSGNPASVAASMGEIQQRLDATYLPAAQRLATGQATNTDQTSLDSFCSSIRTAGWPLQEQFRNSGWGKLTASLDALSQSLGPMPSSTSVINVPDYSEDQSVYTGGTPGSAATSESQPSTSGITVNIGPTGSGA